MKQQFSTQWLSSKQPRKQRKYIYNAPLHIRHKFLSAHLSKDLRKKYGKRSLPLRKGDEVLVMRGSFKKKKAKITSIDVKNTKVVLEGLQRTKKDGSKVNVYVHPSCLQIQSLDLGDKRRLDALNRKSSKSPAQGSKLENKENKNAPDKTGSKH
jgi:large subunit ribosomal protein L24